MKHIAWMVLVILTSGCASQQLAVTYYSDPPGAVLYEDITGTRFGYTPVTLYYTVSTDDRKNGQTRIRGTKVIWISGASSSYNYIDCDLNRFGYNQSVTYKRPDDVPGREQDERFALDLNNQRMQQQQYRQQYQQQQQQQEENHYQACMNRAKDEFDKANCQIESGGYGLGKSISNGLNR